MPHDEQPIQRFRLEQTAGVVVADADLLEDMRCVARDLGSGVLSSRLYQTHGKYSAVTASIRFGSWNNALIAAGLPVNFEINISTAELFVNLRDVWVQLGRQPRRREMLAPLSKYSQRPYARLFGSWRKALEAFACWAERAEELASDSSTPSMGSQPRTGRDPNLALRFRVMRRDSFTCQHCGRSPARDPGVELHVDHIVPWARGGETTLENLRTLCSKCNLGKGTQSESAPDA